MIGSYVLGQIQLTWVSICVLLTDTPSSPSIDQVEPYSSTAQVQFDEPEATGGVPILKYKAEWRAMGEEVWHSKWYDAKEGKFQSRGLLEKDVSGHTHTHPVSSLDPGSDVTPRCRGMQMPPPAIPLSRCCGAVTGPQP